MPIYEYRCGEGHTFEVMQRMSDDPVETCLTCERPVQRVLHPVAIHFKGSGFHNTDYGKAKRGGSSDGESADGSGDKADKSGDAKKSGETATSSGESKGSGEGKGGKESKGSSDSSSKATSGSSSA